jgi:Protein of unknown function (DUF1308)
MYVFDITAVIAMVSELTYDLGSVSKISEKRCACLSVQIRQEQENPGGLGLFFQQFNQFFIDSQDFQKADLIITKIGGEKEKFRWETLKPKFSIILSNTLDHYNLITANKKLKKRKKNVDFIYHIPRSLLGL